MSIKTNALAAYFFPIVQAYVLKLRHVRRRNYNAVEIVRSVTIQRCIRSNRNRAHANRLRIFKLYILINVCLLNQSWSHKLMNHDDWFLRESVPVCLSSWNWTPFFHSNNKLRNKNDKSERSRLNNKLYEILYHKLAHYSECLEFERSRSGKWERS